MIPATAQNPAITLAVPSSTLFHATPVHGANTGPRFPSVNPPLVTPDSSSFMHRSLTCPPLPAEAETSAAVEQPQTLLRSGAAPVVSLSAADAASAASALAQSIQHHWKPIAAMKADEAAAVPARFDVIDQITQTACEPDPSDQLGLMLYGDHRSYGELWDDRIANTIDVARDMATYCSKGEAGAVFGYQLGQGMVGLLAMDPAMPVVRYACSHPATQNAAGALFQAAVAHSASCGWNGELALFSYEDAMPAYEALGFVKNDNQAKRLLKTTNGTLFDAQYMMLRPAESDKWCQVNDLWTLKSNVNQRFITALDSTSKGDTAIELANQPE
ncbi:hypothetical protein [Duganella qianjiadongensis]|uniref:N-acetyltransferase domain-containing protein n=1 Tax=Duganella qianjiadongensis TaxID=2692176 RepID=A0ABW9VRV1_9BURK|nr:hypothetical protein [Duganella qianjiadongensis]MYM41455.1 hypothetical protein [Duganella qianjiadongensis]